MEVKKMENVNGNGLNNKLLNSVAWGAFFVVLGLGWITSITYAVDVGAYIAIGIGAILVAINLVRLNAGISLSKFSLFIGLIAFALGGAGLIGYALPLIPTIIVLVGLFVVAEGIQKVTTHPKQQN
jgi:D-alanyl-lipoteichoic acid acyltransferase DltB (MBOAT superfamily)